MTPEEYQRLKEAEKEHLRALKKLKQQLRDAERRKNVSQAMRNIEEAPGEDILRTHDEMIERLSLDTALGEAKLDVALSGDEIRDMPAEKAPEMPAPSDEELEKLRAQELVRQMKIQMGTTETRTRREETTSGTPTPAANATKSDKPNPTTPGDLPEKTIGRIPKKKS